MVTGIFQTNEDSLNMDPGIHFQTNIEWIA